MTLTPLQLSYIFQHYGLVIFNTRTTSWNRNDIMSFMTIYYVVSKRNSNLGRSSVPAHVHVCIYFTDFSTQMSLEKSTRDQQKLYQCIMSGLLDPETIWNYINIAIKVQNHYNEAPRVNTLNYQQQISFSRLLAWYQTVIKPLCDVKCLDEVNKRWARK